jgi:hypothetical protein
VSAAAPGRITSLDFTRPWWAGVADSAQLFGRTVALDHMRAVPVQILVGAADTGPAEAGAPAGQPDATGRDRVERARSLHASLARHGSHSRLDVVAGAGHEHEPLLPCAQRFLASVLPSGQPEPRLSGPARGTV